MPPKKPKKPSRTIKPFKTSQRYTYALGAFVQAFAAAESQLFLFLARCAGLQITVARALLSGPRVEGQVDLLRRLWQLYPPIPAIHEEMEDFLSQLLALQKVRNSILHNMSLNTSDKGKISTNYIRALTDNATREYPVTWQSLFQMSDDLFKIIDHMLSLVKHPTASLEDRAKEWPTLLDAWLYKPPQDHSLKPPPRWLEEEIARQVRDGQLGSSP